jgi:hypothetical protein
MASKSQYLRKQGNVAYKNVNKGFAQFVWPALRKTRLEKALSLYAGALSAAFTLADKIAASKNLGMASSKMYRFHKERKRDDKLVEFYLFETVKHFSSALEYGCDQPEGWRQHLIDQVGDVVELWMCTIRKLPSLEKVNAMVKIVDKIPCCNKSAEVNLLLADALVSSPDSFI